MAHCDAPKNSGFIMDGWVVGAYFEGEVILSFERYFQPYKPSHAANHDIAVSVFTNFPIPTVALRGLKYVQRAQVAHSSLLFLI